MTLMQAHKLPPHSIEAEQSVIGSLLADPRRMIDVGENLRPEDFYRADHQVIWGAMLALADARKPADFVTVCEHLRQTGRLDEAGGMQYVGQLSLDYGSSWNAAAYAEIIRERAALRSVIGAAGELADLGYHPDGRSHAEILDEAERLLLAIRNRGEDVKGGPRDVSEIVEQVERAIEARRGGTGVSGLPTGLVDFDIKTTGLHPGDLMILAGRPSMGKTTLAMTIAEHCAFQVKHPVLVFSMEMPAAQLTERMIASRGRVPLSAIRSGQLHELDFGGIVRAGSDIRSAPIRIDETPALSPAMLRSRARRERARRGGLGLIVVDYLQLMQVPGTKENRTGEITQISRELKALAKELAVPVIALSQLNRAVESRDNKRPRMSDLRESGGIEQDADLVVFVYRDEVYHPESLEAGTAELIIGKQRNGPLGTVRAAFLGQFSRFDNLAPEWMPAAPGSDPQPKPRRGFARHSGASHAAHAAPSD